MTLLQEGQIFEIKEGDTVYADVPKHFLYDNKKGVWDLTHAAITVEGEFSYMKGRYIVTKTLEDGGGEGHGRHDVYPNGHHVFCQSLDIKEVIKLDFYQSGCFSATIENREPTGRGTLTWTEDK